MCNQPEHILSAAPKKKSRLLHAAQPQPSCTPLNPPGLFFYTHTHTLQRPTCHQPHPIRSVRARAKQALAEPNQGWGKIRDQWNKLPCRAQPCAVANKLPGGNAFTDASKIGKWYASSSHDSHDCPTRSRRIFPRLALVGELGNLHALIFAANPSRSPLTDVTAEKGREGKGREVPGRKKTRRRPHQWRPHQWKGADSDSEDPCDCSCDCNCDCAKKTKADAVGRLLCPSEFDLRSHLAKSIWFPGFGGLSVRACQRQLVCGVFCIHTHLAWQLVLFCAVGRQVGMRRPGPVRCLACRWLLGIFGEHLETRCLHMYAQLRCCCG